MREKVISLFADSGNRCILFLTILLSVGLYYFATWPIVARDTDLWYHLSGGRYFFETGSVARTSFFSFLTPPRTWVNYYWLFQVLVFKMYTFFGYQGLIALRAVLFLATSLLLLGYLFRNQKRSEIVLYLTVLSVFCFLTLIPRGLTIRPHIFSYFLLLLFLYLLEYRPGKALYILPVAGALWVNLHGVEYPVMFLLLGAYLGEYLLRWRTGRLPLSGLDPGFLLPVLLCFGTVFLTPYGESLLRMPFISTERASLHIFELKRLTFYDFLSFFGILFFLSWLTALLAIGRKNIRLSHLLLFVGGVILLAKGKRFINEFVLLSLPVLSAYVPFRPEGPRTALMKPVAAGLAVLFMAMPFFYLHYFFSDAPRYPLSARELPRGIAIFLNQVGARGSVMNYPNNGGYLEWMLYPRCRILMDMQMPFLFSDKDFETARAAFSSAGPLSRFLAEYDPSFIVVPLETAIFPDLIKGHPDYRPVFFDDSDVLYANRVHYASLVERYELRAVNPFRLVGSSIEVVASDEPYLKELLRLNGTYPESGVVNVALAMIYQKKGDYRAAMKHAEIVIDTYPESFAGYKLKGGTLAALKRCGEATRYYRKAMDRADPEAISAVQREMSACRSGSQ